MGLQEFVFGRRSMLQEMGFEELKTPQEVDLAMKRSKTTLVFVNSVCGCATRTAIPAVEEALKNKKIPDHITTVFAGQDKEATKRAREYFIGYEPSSPSFALLENGKVISMIQRDEIRHHEPEEVFEKLTALFNKHC